MTDQRIVERKDDNNWTRVESIMDLVPNNVFRLFESTGELVGVFKAVDDPYLLEGTPAILSSDIDTDEKENEI